jgi:hypothetical protein
MSEQDNDGPFGDDDSKAGYGRPPKHSRFKKGQSGNTRGRPKGAKNKPPAPDDLAKIVAEEGSRLMKVKRDGESEMMSTARLITRKVMMDAAAGNHRSQKLALTLMAQSRDKRLDRDAATFAEAFKYKTFCQERIAEAQRSGKPSPHFSPHPDSIVLDFETQEVRCLELMPDAYELMRGYEHSLAYFQTAAYDICKGGYDADHGQILFEELVHVFEQMKIVSKALDIPWSENERRGPDFKRLRRLKDKVLADVT